MYKDIFKALREASLVKNNLNTRKINHEEVPTPQKPYPEDAQLIALPEPDYLEDKEVSFLELMELRSTIREYSERPLTMKELSFLLWCTQGVKMVLPAGATKRTVPSAGARNAFETYLYIDKVEGLEKGLYRFLAFEHALLPVDIGDGVKERLQKGFNKINMYDASAVTFMWAAVLDRMDYAFGISRRAGCIYDDSFRLLFRSIIRISRFAFHRQRVVLFIQYELRRRIFKYKGSSAFRILRIEQNSSISEDKASHESDHIPWIAVHGYGDPLSLSGFYPFVFKECSHPAGSIEQFAIGDLRIVFALHDGDPVPVLFECPQYDAAGSLALIVHYSRPPSCFCS